MRNALRFAIGIIALLSLFVWWLSFDGDKILYCDDRVADRITRTLAEGSQLRSRIGRSANGPISTFIYVTAGKGKLRICRVQMQETKSFRPFKRSGGDTISLPIGAERLEIPLLPLSLLSVAAVAGLTLIPLIRRRRKLREDLCSNCGYNLTGNVSGVCPECGTKVEER
jgi:hypothetical protein